LSGLARLWDAESGAELAVFRGHAGRVRDIAWSPDGTRIATASADKTVRIWDAANGAEMAILRGHEDEVRTVAWSPDGQRVVSSSRDKTARIFNARGWGDPLVLRGHGHWIYSAKFSPDGHHVITSALDTSIRWWNLDDIIAPIVLRGHEDAISAGQFSPDGKYYATTSFDSTVRVWHTDGDAPEMVLRGHSGMIRRLAWSHAGKRLATCSNDKTARVWTIDNSSTPVVLRGHSGDVRNVAWSPDDSRIVTGAIDGTLRLWSPDGLELAQTTKPATEGHFFFEPAGRFVVGFDSGHPDVWTWNLENHDPRQVIGKHDKPIENFVRNADGYRFLTTSLDGTVRLWDIRSRDPLMVFQDSVPIRWAAWSPDGDRVALVFADDRVQVRQAGVVIGARASVMEAMTATKVAWMPDSKRIISGTEGPLVRMLPADGAGIPFVFTG